MRLAAVFVAVCMVLIAGSAGAAVYFAFGFRVAEAVLVAVGVLTALSAYNTVSARMGMRTVVGSQLRDLSRGGADMARHIAEIERGLSTLERRVEGTLNKARAAADPLSNEIGELSLLVKQLAETVASHEARLAELQRSQPPALPETPKVVATAPMPAPAVTAPSAVPVAPAPVALAPAVPTPVITTAEAPPPAANAAEQAAVEAMRATIRAAIEANRIDLYLQPIVTLPQRKVRYYEAMSRLRTDKGEVVPAASFVGPAESGALMPKIDNLVVFRCVQVIRRLHMKNREIGLFCNVSGATLTNGSMFPQLLDFLDANRAIAPALVLEFTQSALRNVGPLENESLSALAERGFRFSLDNVTDLRIEPRELATRGFRFVKVPAAMLLNRVGAAASDIHPADLSDLLGRFGIDLIAEKIESEGSVVDLLDYDVRFGQGFLFSPPRPVRAEALQGIADRDLVTRDASIPDEANPTAPRAPEPVAAAVAAPDAGNGKRVSAITQIARRI